MNNRLARQALQEATARVKTGVRQGAESFVEREVAPLRARVEELERQLAHARQELAEQARRIDRLERGAGS